MCQNECRICIHFDDFNEQPECMDCTDGSNFSTTALEPSETSWDDVIKNRQTTFTECEVCGEQDNCVEIKQESFVVDVCRDCLGLSEKPRFDWGDLSGPEGNVFVILGKARRIALENDMDWNKIRTEATSGDYEHAKDTMRKYFEVVK